MDLIKMINEEIVYHELLHSAFCVKHDTNSIIMNPYGREKGEYSSQVLDAELIKEVKKARNIR